MKPEPERGRLPFEPAKNRKKPAKNRPGTASPDEPKQENKTSVSKQEKAKQTKETKSPVTRKQMAVPEAVSERMIRRMALFSGIPTALGMTTFIASYFIVTNKWFDLPNVAVVLVSMGFFGLGVLGLSYGVISASWDEEEPGSKIGWSEFTTNFKRLTGAWRDGKKNSQS